MSADSLAPRPFTVQSGEVELAGEAMGEGPPVLLAHGLTAMRRYVLHGSKALARRGFETVAYDARGHGESDPAPAGGGYSYPELVEDMEAVVDDRVGSGPMVLAGHSMGAHTAIAAGLGGERRTAALVLICPVYWAVPLSDEQLREWDELASGLERSGVEGFISAYERDLDPEWRQTLVRIARDRLSRHRHPEAVAQALREVPRGRPFEDLSELELLDVPALVVASRDEADPGHPYSVAEAYAERIPGATFVVEEEGKSPLAWQGGRLAREIADFLEGPEVAERLRA